MSRFIRTKDGAVAAAPRALATGSGRPLIYSNDFTYSNEEGETIGLPEVELTIPLTEPKSLFIRAEIESLSPNSNAGGVLMLEKQDGATSEVPRIVFYSDAFSPLQQTLQGVISVEVPGDYQIKAIAAAVDLSGGEDEPGWSYVYLKIVVMVCEYTGDNSVIWGFVG